MDQEQTNIGDILTSPQSLTYRFIAAAHANERLHEYNSQDPRLGHVLIVQPGDGLMAIARDLAPLYPDNPAVVELTERLAEHNALLGPGGRWQDVRLQIGQNIVIPLPAGTEIYARDYSRQITAPGTALPSLVAEFAAASLHVPEGRSPQQLERLLNRLNPELTEESHNINIPAPDDFSHIVPLRAPASDDGRAAASLFIVEPDSASIPGLNAPHHKISYDFARDYTNALNPDREDRAPVFSVAEPDYGSTTISLLFEDSPAQNEYVIFNHSYTYTGHVQSPTPETDLETIHFISAGNSAQVSGLEDFISAHNAHLGPRSYVVGAAHMNPYTGPVVAGYSSPGADILAPPLPLYNGNYAPGTSFASPMMAALDRQMLENYGGTLTQEEIMSAAFMSTDMALHDPRTNAPVRFETNSGGQPNNLHAGAGMIDPERWQDNLDIMASMKRTMEYVPEMIHERITLPEPVVTDTNLGPRYTYSIAMPADMTLDRLSFVLTPQNPAIPLINTEITSPSGFKQTVPDTALNARGTSAFALEDVREGDIMTITTTAPLDTNAAYVDLNGHGDGNVVQALRDHLQEFGMMPTPLTSYTGANPTADTEYGRTPTPAQTPFSPQPLNTLPHPSENKPFELKF